MAAREEFGEDIFCPKCAFCLHLAPGDKCPECGYSLESLRCNLHPIPWTLRRERGRFKTYWQTVSLVTFRHVRFCEHYAHDVQLRDARSFQCATVLYVFIPVLLGIVAAYVSNPVSVEFIHPFTQMGAVGAGRLGPTVFEQAIAEIWPVALQLGFFLPFLFAATGVASYFFDRAPVSVQRQHSAVAMSYYVCAPLVFLVPLVLIQYSLVTAVMFFDEWLMHAWRAREWLNYTLFFAGVIVIGAYWWSLLRLAGRIMPQLPGRRVALALGLPLVWVGLGIILLGLLPLSVLYVLVVFLSFGA